MDRLRAELYIINRMLGIMSERTDLTTEEKELEKRKKFLEFLIENA